MDIQVMYKGTYRKELETVLESDVYAAIALYECPEAAYHTPIFPGLREYDETVRDLLLAGF